MLILGVARNPQRALGIIGRNADPVADNGLRELAGTDKNRPFQPSSVPQFLTPPDVLADGKRKLQYERREAKNQLRVEELVERDVGIYPVLDPCVKSLVRVTMWLFAE